MRKLSESSMYHVVVRGTGRQLIFEDERDCEVYLERLCGLLGKANGELLAWCLMGNHAHFLLHLDMEQLSLLMRRLGTGYAMYFNLRHDRVGHLFQGRFTSVPIQTDEQLLQTVRYIHLNPVKAGIGTLPSYTWSSYGEYLGSERWCCTALVLDMLGGVEGFRAFHELQAANTNAVGLPRRRMTDASAVGILEDVLAEKGLGEIPVERSTRNALIARLKGEGLSVRQIERLTGIGRNIIERAV